MIPTTPVPTCLLDNLMQTIDHYEFKAHQVGERPYDYYTAKAYEWTLCAITIGLRGPEIGPPWSTDSFHQITY